MEFVFSEDQLLLQQTIRDFLEGECTVEQIRSMWDLPSGRSPEFWAKLAEIGVPGLLVPEEYDGLGMDEIDMVLVLEETGRVALAEPVIHTAAVGAPMLAESGNQAVAGEWLPKIAEGRAIVCVGHEQSPFVSDAHIADLLLLAFAYEPDVPLNKFRVVKRGRFDRSRILHGFNSSSRVRRREPIEPWACYFNCCVTLINECQVYVKQLGLCRPAGDRLAWGARS